MVNLNPGVVLSGSRVSFRHVSLGCGYIVFVGCTAGKAPLPFHELPYHLGLLHYNMELPLSGAVFQL